MLDIAVLAAQVNDEHVRNRALPPLRMSLVARRGLLKQRRITLAELAQFNLITFQRNSHPNAVTVDVFRRARISPQRLHFCSSISAMLTLVESGFGIATLPRAAIAPWLAAGEVVEVNCDFVLPALPLTVAWREDPAAGEIERVVNDIVGAAHAHAARETKTSRRGPKKT